MPDEGRAFTPRPWLQAVEPAHGIWPAERSIKCLDNPQLAAAARARGWLVFGVVEVLVIIVVATYRRSVHGQQASAELKFLGAVAVRQEPVVTNTMKAGHKGKVMRIETAEFMRRSQSPSSRAVGQG